mmetsp:Transcript_152584/g.370351  ORF Transcript_152584/g.370351 Transcript_152584/m.370351 type:complete len:258 (+) Transcript_152584:91-864(+)
MQSTRSGPASRRGAKARDQNSEARVVFRQQFRKTELCRFYQSGCVKGSNCCFAHGESELRIAPDLTKTSLCQDWIDRRCPLTAEACQFAHGWSDMHTTLAFVEYGARQSKKGTSQTSSSCEASTANGEIGNVVETPLPPSRPQRRTSRRSAASAEPGLQAGGGAGTSASGSSQGSPTVQHVGFDARAAGQPVVLVRQPESDGVHAAVVLQPWGAVLGEVPLLPLQLAAAGVLQPQQLPDDRAMEVLLRQAMPDHYDD